MKKVLIPLLMLIFMAGCGSDKKSKSEKNFTNLNGSVSKTEPAGKQMKMIKVPAPSLKNNLLGEKAEREVGVYLPENYETENKTYPVVYFLVGYGQTISEFDGWANLERIMAVTRADKGIKDMILVAVDGQTKAGGSFYTNSPVMGNWEDFISKDLVSYMDNNYKTLKDKASRGISGHSMGGFGAINVGMKHPDVFSQIYSIDPGLYNEAGLEYSLFYSDSAIEEQYNIIKEFQSADKAKNEKNDSVFKKDSFVTSYGMAFSPAEKMPFYEIPYDKKGDKFIKNRKKWKNWENGFGNWSEKVKTYRKNFLKLGGLVIDYGICDSYTWIPEGCKYFDKLLISQGISHEMIPNPVGHGDLMQKRMTKSMFPYFSKTLKF